MAGSIWNSERVFSTLKQIVTTKKRKETRVSDAVTLAEIEVITSSSTSCHPAHTLEPLHLAEHWAKKCWNAW